MGVTGTQFNYYFICHRKLWLFSNGIQMEHTSELVYDGKLVHEYSYPQRTEKYQEIEIAGIKIDFFDPVRKVIHEIKRSDKIDTAHEWQLKYYIYVLENMGIEGVTGILEYPELRKTDKVFLSSIDREEIGIIETKINELVTSEVCPVRLQSSRCKNCSYFDFCWSGEPEDEK
jgi:CRISPR-associated exonuclease Cas4